MDMVRKSVSLSPNLSPRSSIDRLSLPTAIKTIADGPHTNMALASCIKKCSEIFPLLVNKEFESKYWTFPNGVPDCYVFFHASRRCLCIELVTRFPDSQMENLHTYNFINHPMFEEKLNAYTRCKSNEKPNQSLVRSRPWDVALNVVMKIEALSAPYNKYQYVLKREFDLLEYMWKVHVKKRLDIDEMTGLPMVFEFVEVPNDIFFVSANDIQTEEVDKFGRVKELDFSDLDTRSTLAYMTMEKLGPSVDYLLQLVRSTNVQPFTFDLWTSMKIFDQLLCRILQIHKFYIVHNDICPENIYLGNGIAFGVVYLNCFKRSYLVDDGKEGPSGLAKSFMGCAFRFASSGQLSGVGSSMQPIDDIESAFYVLLAMLSANNLPWDYLLKEPKSCELSDTTLSQEGDTTDPSLVSGDKLRNIRNFKQKFWDCNEIIGKVLSNIGCTFNNDKRQAANATSTVLEIYHRVKSWRQSFNNIGGSFKYCTQLNITSSDEFRQFIELRRLALVNFKFSETFDIINDLRFRKRVSHELHDGSLQQQPWDAFVWCFNGIEVRPDTRLQSIHTE